MPSVMCSLSAVQSHGSWPPFHGTDAMNEHDGGRHHFLAMACFRAFHFCARVRKKQKQEAAAGCAAPAQSCSCWRPRCAPQVRSEFAPNIRARLLAASNPSARRARTTGVPRRAAMI